MGDYSVKRIYMDVAVLPPIARDYVLACKIRKRT